MTDVLCIGTTGMLAGCVRSLVSKGNHAMCIARSQQSLDALAGSVPPEQANRLSLHACDYRDLAGLRSELEHLLCRPHAAICWVHTPAEPVLRLIRDRYPEMDLLRVRGSSTQRPADEAAGADRLVTLGFVIEHARSRWLTHHEISAGVYDAFVSGARESIVGVIEPWDQSP